MRLFQVFIFGLTFMCSGNFIVSAQPDSLKTKMLGPEEFIQIIRQYHPVAKQASLLPEQAKAQLRIARGGFDPLLYSNYENKILDGVNYYSYFENKFSIPAWYGIEVKAGYDFVYGQNTNPENKLSPDGLGYLGVSVPLGRNLFTDARRTALRQAKLFREATEQQRLIILNDLFFDALGQYYEWQLAYFQLQILRKAVQLAEVRYDATKTSVRLGDRPAIDTTEALTQLQYRQFQMNETYLHWVNEGLTLSNFLWLDNDQPYTWDTTITPALSNPEIWQQDIRLDSLEELMNLLPGTHPALLNTQIKYRSLQIERKLKIESLKPLLNVQYNVLNSGFRFVGSPAEVVGNNYKLGVNFAMPLTFAQARGELRLNKLKLMETNYELNLKTRELVNKLRSYVNELVITQQQIRLFDESLDNFKKLFDGETQRFQAGESSVFLVNMRENRFVEVQLKNVELQAKYMKTEAAVKWAAALLPQ